MIGPEAGSVRRYSLSFMADAWLGREGRTLTAEKLRSFYARSYLDRNPEMDAADAPYKANLLADVCAMGGVSRVGSLLEIGCGSGALLAEMKKRLNASLAIGVDYSHAIALSGRQRFGHQVSRSDGASLPFRNGAFDLVYFADVLEHVLQPDRFLREVLRVGRRTAFLIPVEAGWLTTPIYVSRRVRGKSTNYEQYGHIWRWNRRQIFKFLRAAGVQLDQSRCYQAPFRIEGMNRLGRMVETMRVGTAKVSPHMAEVLFGTGAFIGLTSGG